MNLRDIEHRVELLERSQGERAARIAALEAELRKAHELLRAFQTNDAQKLLDSLTVAGFPAVDIKDIYAILQEWQTERVKRGLGESYLTEWRQRQELRELVMDMEAFIRFLRPDLDASRSRADELVRRAQEVQR